MPYTKTALLIMLCLIGTVFGTTIYWSWNTPATHPALAAAELPGLIPVRDFYADMPAESSFKPSHNEQYVAWPTTRKANQAVFVRNQTTRQELMRIKDVHSYFGSRTARFYRLSAKVDFGGLITLNPQNTTGAISRPKALKGGQFKVRHRPEMMCLLSHQVTATRPFQISKPPGRTAAIKRS